MRFRIGYFSLASILASAPITHPTAQAQGLQVFNAVKLSAPDLVPIDQFGIAACLSGDRAIVGANRDDTSAGSHTGSAFIFERQVGGAWNQVAKFTGNDVVQESHYGVSVSLEGDRALIGAYGGGVLQGVAYIVERQATGVWTQVAKLVANDGAAGDCFGWSVSISGDRALVGARFATVNGAPVAGAAYVFQLISGNWSQVAKLIASDASQWNHFGYSVSLSGTHAIIGAPGYLFGPLTTNMTGVAYIFEEQQGNSWTQTAKLIASDAQLWDEFGGGVSIDHDLALVGAPLDTTSAGAGSGSVYGFQRQGNGSWTQTAHFMSSDAAPNDNLGIFLSMSNGRAIVGSVGTDIGSIADAGAGYLFEHHADGTWTQTAKLHAPNASAGDHFGFSISLDGNNILLGSNYPNNDAGLVYVYRFCEGCVNHYGVGKPGCNGPHTIGVTVEPEIGASAFGITCDKAPPSSLGLALVTDSSDLAGPDLFGVGIPTYVSIATSEVYGLDLISDATGVAIAPAALPNDPALIGKTYYSQAIWSWALNICLNLPFGLSSSDGLVFTIQ